VTGHDRFSFNRIRDVFLYTFPRHPVRASPGFGQPSKPLGPPHYTLQLASADRCIVYAARVSSCTVVMKRKADSDSSVVATTSSSGSSAKRQSITTAGKPESSKTAAMRGPATTQTVISPEENTRLVQSPKEDIPRPSEPTSELPNASRTRKIAEISARLISPVLPAGKVFPIRIGSDLFQLSGASISSDGNSTGSYYLNFGLTSLRLRHTSPITLASSCSRPEANLVPSKPYI
jgi:hypothetical protein